MVTIKSIKTKAIIALILSVFALLPYVGVHHSLLCCDVVCD